MDRLLSVPDKPNVFMIWEGKKRAKSVRYIEDSTLLYCGNDGN